MEIGGDTEGEVGENNADGGGVNVFGEAAVDEAAEEAERDGGGEAEKEPEHRNRYSDRRGHGTHLHGFESVVG